MANLNALGGVLPALNTAISAANTAQRAANMIGGSASRDLRDRSAQASAQLAERNRLDEQVAAQKAEREKALMEAQAAQDERRRAGALRAAVSRTRAQAGGAGTGTDDGSGAAVLLGLYNESEEDRAAQEKVYNLRRQIVDDNLSSMKSRNLLAESQMTQRYRTQFGAL